jgi:hypothetical protein
MLNVTTLRRLPVGEAAAAEGSAAEGSFRREQENAMSDAARIAENDG